MHTVEAALELVTTQLPEVRAALPDEEWRSLAQQLRGYAPVFEQVADEEALQRAVSGLLQLLMCVPTVIAILSHQNQTSHADSEQMAGLRHPLSTHQPAEGFDIPAVANRFFLLCEQADRAGSKPPLSSFAAQPAAGLELPQHRDRATSSVKD